MFQSVEKPPRSPHVIHLTDLIRKLEKYPELDSLVVAWSSAVSEEGETRIGVSSLGSDASCHFLTCRAAALLLSGGVPRQPMPSDR